MRIVATLFLLIQFSSVEAEIFRKAIPCGESGKFCFYWWPKLGDVDGWHQDMAHSYHYRANTQAPEGSNFASAETVIYAKAVYKPEKPEAKNLAEFIENDKSSIISGSQSIDKSEILIDRKGREYITYIFTPNPNGNWEKVAYSEEVDKDNNEYYLVFVLSSRTQSGFNESSKVFSKYVANYE